MVGYAVLFAVTVVVFLFVLQPLLIGRKVELATSPSRLADLQARRAYLLDAIRDNEFDFESGKIDETEYDEVRRRFLQEAAVVSRELEEEARAVDAEIDREIEELRRLARQAGRPSGGETATTL